MRDFLKVFAGWLAVPAGTTGIIAGDIPGIIEKPAQREEA